MSTLMRPQAALYLGLLVLTGLSFQNCAKQDFSLINRESQEASLGVDAEVPGGGGGDEVDVICDPFGGGTQVGAGLKAKLVYYDGPNPGTEIRTLDDVFGKGREVPNTVILFGQVSVPTRSFRDGFDGPGGKLTDTNGQRLVEWFGLDFESNLQLGAADSDGLYQLATISDDGSVLSVDAGAGSQVVVDNDGYASTRMACGAVLQMKKGQRFPMRLRYFQGPADEIALNLLWRKVDAATNLQPSYCGTQGGFYSASAQTDKYKELQKDGWKVLAPDNFALTKAIPNSCK